MAGTEDATFAAKCLGEFSKNVFSYSALLGFL